MRLNDKKHPHIQKGNAIFLNKRTGAQPKHSVIFKIPIFSELYVML